MSLLSKKSMLCAGLTVALLQACNDGEFTSKSSVQEHAPEPEIKEMPEDSLDNAPEKPAEEPVPEPAIVEEPEKLPKIGLLVNDLKCGLCHVKIIGDVGSTRDVDPVWNSSNVEVSGAWFAAQAFKANVPDGISGVNVSVKVRDGLKTNYVGPELPKTFPTPNYVELPTRMRGVVTASANGPVSANKVHKGNLILIGTADKPILISKDVLVEGDLIIAGYYKGIGTIYVTGNIYIPADLRAVKSVFPYPEDAAGAKAKAMNVVTDKSYDGLGLVSKNSIFIADLEKTEFGTHQWTMYNHSATPPDRTYAALGVLNVYNWIPGGKPAYEALYGSAVDCKTGAARRASFNMVEAFLYAGNTIGGVSRNSTFSIRGGVIADHFHIISGARDCTPNLNPVHGRPMNKNYVEYDFRLQTGLFPILERISQ